MRSYSFYEAHTYIDPGDDALDRTLTAFTVHTLTSQLATLSACMQFGLKFGAAVAPQDALAGVATAYASLVPTGSVVVMTTNLVRYFNPNKKPSPDFPMISAMHTGVAFRPACNVHIRGESMVTTSTQLMVSNIDAARDPNTLEFRSPRPSCKATDFQLATWRDDEVRLNNRKFIPAAVVLAAAAVGGSYYFVGTDQHQFVSIKLLPGIQ